MAARWEPNDSWARKAAKFSCHGYVRIGQRDSNLLAECSLARSFIAAVVAVVVVFVLLVRFRPEMSDWPANVCIEKLVLGLSSQ